MYEFTDKKVREKFKKTAYGKKITKSFKTAIGICAMFLLLLMGFSAPNYYGNEIIDESVLDFLRFIVFISIVIAVYFDGKRDGAIEQYKRIK